jgi:8-oxo-dGTP pyrophosphatase MutT (NUDIX family)
MATDFSLRPASTVVLLRDGSNGLETLLLKRNKALMFAGGLWVFPGGAIDPEDIEAAGGEMVAASRIAAAREAREESGLQPRLEDMLLLGHWTTPVAEAKRFATWIYAAPVASDEEVTIDGSEIHDSRWIGVREAVAAHQAGELGMLPPTVLNLCDLSRYDNVATLLEGERDRVADEVLPVIGKAKGQMMVMFRGDAGYETGNPALEGGRHRAIFTGHSWHYVYRDVEGFPSIVRGS